MRARSRTLRSILTATALLAAGAGVSLVNSSVAHAVSGTGGLIDITTNAGQCTAATAIDAYDAAWTWTKPTLEYAVGSGSYATAAGTDYGLKLCRDVSQQGGGMVQAYWFIIQKASGNDDMDGMTDIANTTFRVTIPLKTGDTMTRLSGYSEVVSLKESNNVAVVETKASGLSKVNYGNAGNNPSDLAAFKTAHPECGSTNAQTVYQCEVNKADRDIKYMVIQHLEYSPSALTSFQTMYKGMWIGANVNGYNINLTCGTFGSENTDTSDNGANKPAGSTSSTGGSLEVSVKGTPHLTAAGTLNSGSLKAFIPGEIASKCFGDGKAETTLSTIATALTMTRTEATESNGAAQPLTAGTAFTTEAVTSPVAGILVKVPTMTFSSPTYSVKSKLAPTAAAGGGSSKVSGSIIGTKVKLSISLSAKGTYKVYVTIKGKAKLLATKSGKSGTNSVSVALTKGAKYTVKDSKGKVVGTYTAK